MRVSEKTLEINICAQAYAATLPGQRLVWFGLTQKQEAAAGFDVCAKLGGRLLIIQFKASAHTLKSGVRKFHAPHYQLENLRNYAGSKIKSVFYAFPLVGTTLELARTPDLLSNTVLLDVATLGKIGDPTKADGSLRANGCHNVYVTRSSIEIHSDPVKAQALNMLNFISEGFVGTDRTSLFSEWSKKEFLTVCECLNKGAVGLVVAHHNNSLQTQRP